MPQNEHEGRMARRVLLPVALLHVVCCGGLLLWALLGSAALATAGAWLDSAFVHAAAALLLVTGLVLLWRRFSRATSATGSDEAEVQREAERLRRARS